MVPPILNTLAQAGNSSAVANTLLWLAAILVLVIGTGLGVLAFRKRILSKGGEGDQDQSLMDALRAMRDRGEITPEEFEATRRKMVQRLAASLDADSAPTKNTNKTVRTSLHTGRPQSQAASRPRAQNTPRPPNDSSPGTPGTPPKGRTP